MTLAELLQKLSLGPLSDLSIAGEGTGVVPAANIPKLVLRANASLVAFYTRFALLEKTLILATVDGIYNYVLDPKYAQTSASAELNKYIQDTEANPFVGDVLKLLEVATADGCPLPLNDRKAEGSWFTPAYDTLAMDYPKTGDTYQVTYRARHLPLELNPADPTQVEIRLPPALEEAFLVHIAGNVYGGMNGEAALAKSQLLLSQYEALCAFHENADTFATSRTTTHDCYRDTGWV